VLRILDPCAGKGALTKPWRRRRVIAFEIERCSDFFSCPKRIDCDLVLCNPPFNQEQDSPAVYKPEQFLRRIVEVVLPKTPIALIVPMGMRLNQNKGSKRWRWLRDRAPAISSIVSLPRDIFGSVDFHCEVLLFNMPRLKPHYFLPDRYL
jgi:type I restriction enzyme M protein